MGYYPGQSIPFFGTKQCVRNETSLCGGATSISNEIFLNFSFPVQSGMFLSLLPPFFIFPLSHHQYCLVWAVQLESPARVTVVRSLQIILAYAVQVVTILFHQVDQWPCLTLNLAAPPGPGGDVRPSAAGDWSRWSPRRPRHRHRNHVWKAGRVTMIDLMNIINIHYHQYSHHIDKMMRRTFVDYWTLWYLQNLLKPKLSRRNPTRYIYSCSWV